MRPFHFNWNMVPEVKKRALQGGAHPKTVEAIVQALKNGEFHRQIMGISSDTVRAIEAAGGSRRDLRKALEEQREWFIETLVRLADDAMSRNGRMSEAITETGRGLLWTSIDENRPFEMPATFA